MSVSVAVFFTVYFFIFFVSILIRLNPPTRTWTRNEATKVKRIKKLEVEKMPISPLLPTSNCSCSFQLAHTQAEEARARQEKYYIQMVRWCAKLEFKWRLSWKWFQMCDHLPTSKRMRMLWNWKRNAATTERASQQRNETKAKKNVHEMISQTCHSKW